MIILKNIGKSYDDNMILDDINLSINEGDVIAIIGPSGGGKSTLLRCINFLDKPDSGQVFFNGVAITSQNAQDIRSKVGMVFQNFNLFPHMTVIDNIVYAPINVLGISSKNAIKRAKELLKKVGLLNKSNVYPHSLSGGQKQRVAIARSLAMDPQVILFDEPTSALDPEMTSEVLEIIKSFAHTGVTMVIITHEINFAKEIANKIVFLDKGKIIEEATPEIFFSNPQTNRAKTFLEKIL